MATGLHALHVIAGTIVGLDVEASACFTAAAAVVPFAPVPNVLVLQLAVLALLFALGAVFLDGRRPPR